MTEKEHQRLDKYQTYETRIVTLSVPVLKYLELLRQQRQETLSEVVECLVKEEMQRQEGKP